jgi:hypothetical protein
MTTAETRTPSHDERQTVALEQIRMALLALLAIVALGALILLGVGLSYILP